MFFAALTIYRDALFPGTTFAAFWAFIGAVFSIGLAASQFGVIIGARTAASRIFAVIDRVCTPAAES